MTTKISGDNISAIANTGVTWNAVTVADGSTQLNASAGNGYFLDTNAGVIDVKLPSSPTRGDTIILADYGNNFATNRVVVDTGGKLIDSTVGGEPGSGGFTIETNGAVVELVFADDTAGWIIKQNNAPSDLGTEAYAEYISATGGTVTTSGDYKIHTFTGDGCFVVSSTGNPIGSDSVDYLVVAGGGGGSSPSGQSGAGGGGGGGGFRESSGDASGSYTTSPLGACVSALPVSAQTYPITVGGGGAAGSPGSPDPATQGGCGSNSVFSTITSTGGGGGGNNFSASCGGNGKPGGSGGGAGGNPDTSVGSGNTPPVSPPQGQNGGPRGPTNSLAGGGGGATEAGQISAGPQGGRGGTGATTLISGTSTSYAGGGGGAAGCSPGPGTGGSGSPCGTGGFARDANHPLDGEAGTTNSGGGGGAGGPGSGPDAGGAGGKGIVIIRYKYQ